MGPERAGATLAAHRAAGPTAWRAADHQPGWSFAGDGASIVEKTMTSLGEQLEAGSRWQGNPAQATGGAC
ncbi:hypothetical protein ABIC99_000397 [Sphaerotilus sulfidivorans]|uniref:Uncharacterized protein n=1 Tax=Sphaerotilus sulfidivorans TaxID=639200 RepID=A0ABV2II83_9BURK